MASATLWTMKIHVYYRVGICNENNILGMKVASNIDFLTVKAIHLLGGSSFWLFIFSTMQDVVWYVSRFGDVVDFMMPWLTHCYGSRNWFYTLSPSCANCKHLFGNVGTLSIRRVQRKWWNHFCFCGLVGYRMTSRPIPRPNHKHHSQLHRWIVSTDGNFWSRPFRYHLVSLVYYFNNSLLLLLARHLAPTSWTGSRLVTNKSKIFLRISNRKLRCAERMEASASVMRNQYEKVSPTQGQVTFPDRCRLNPADVAPR